MEPVTEPMQTSLLGMVLASGPVVMSVLIILLGLSVWSWAITIAKYLQYKKARSHSDEFREIFLESRNFARISDSARRYEASPLSAIFFMGYREVMRLMQQNEGGTGRWRDSEQDLDMIDRALREAQIRETRRLEKGTTFLATVASSAPFIGLFGTVIGIMNAFHGLALQKGTTIQAVAPGISEALFTTAVGLGAAIPAAIAFNYCIVEIKEFRQSMDFFIEEFISVARRSFYSPAGRTTNSKEEVRHHGSFS